MNDIFTEIMDNAIESINNKNRLVANAAQIKRLEDEIAQLKAKISTLAPLPSVSSVDGADYWRQKGLAGIRHRAAQDRYPGV